MGFGIAFVGITPLAIFVLFGDLAGITVGNFLPRMTLTLFIETFAYFFLRLYSNSLIEIKYFKNEITNIEHKFLALKTAVHFRDTLSIREAVGWFAQTDRNAVVQKTPAIDMVVSAALNKAFSAMGRRAAGDTSPRAAT